MREFIKMITITVILVMFFVGTILLSNYVHYGTFIFEQEIKMKKEEILDNLEDKKEDQFKASLFNLS